MLSFELGFVLVTHVLPQPLGPKSPYIVALGTVKLIPLRIRSELE